MTASDAEREAALAAEPLDSTDAALLNSLRGTTTNTIRCQTVSSIASNSMLIDALHAEVATLITMDMATATCAAPPPKRYGPSPSPATPTTMVTLTPQPYGTMRVDGWAAPARVAS